MRLVVLLLCACGAVEPEPVCPAHDVARLGVALDEATIPTDLDPEAVRARFGDALAFYQDRGFPLVADPAGPVVVAWADLDPAKLARTVGQRVDLARSRRWSTGDCHLPEYDLETVLLHELGHVLGFPHAADRSSVMFPAIAPCEERRRFCMP